MVGAIKRRRASAFLLALTLALAAALASAAPAGATPLGALAETGSGGTEGWDEISGTAGSDGAESETETVELQDMYTGTMSYLLSLESELGTGSTYGEWLMFGLARAEADIPESMKKKYINTVLTYVYNNYDKEGKLHSVKATENSRVAIALAALGTDPSNFMGYDLVSALEKDSAWVTDQGNNSTAFALITLAAARDGFNRETDTEACGVLAKSLEDKQLESGGWGISGSSVDQDTTMMVVQALAPYYRNNAGIGDVTADEIKSMVDKALAFVRGRQTADGGFGTSVEGNVQVIVALTSLGIDPGDWVNESGKSVLDAMGRYYVDSDTATGFSHTAGSVYNQMATEQSFYGLAAYYRFKAGKASLYEMGGSGGGSIDDLVGDYKVSVSCPTGGTLEADPAMADEGDQVTVTATPDSGYVLAEGSLAYTTSEAGSAPVAITQAAGDNAWQFTMPASDVTVSCQWEKVTEAEDPEEPTEAQPRFTSFSINGVRGVIDEAGSTVTVTLPVGTALSSLAPVFTVKDAVSVSPANKTAVDFSAGSVTYTLTGSDGTTRSYQVTVQKDMEAYIDNLWDRAGNSSEGGAQGTPWYEKAGGGSYPVYWN